MRKVILILFVLSAGFGMSQDIIKPDVALYNIGEKVIVIGTVDQIKHSDKAVFLNMGGNYPDNPFAAVIFNSDKDNFKNVDSYEGREVEISGIVKRYKGKQEIILNSSAQIKILRLSRVKYHKYTPLLRNLGKEDKED
jgi:DNA/RNA endonuclease YhcR with UshA esterase domain